MKISIVVAVAEKNVIGAKNKLPWYLSADLRRFKELTSGHHIIMGRKTYESIGKPLPNRTNIVITRNKNYKAEGCIVAHSLEEALKAAKENKETEAFIIGGAEIFKEALPIADKIYLTKIHKNFEGDTFFPTIDNNHWIEISKEDDLIGNDNLKFKFLTLVKKKTDDNN